MISADFIVVGAGIAGAGVTYELSRARSVVVLEREAQPGYHSTGRSAALFSETYGNEAIRALTLASRAFLLNPPSDFAAPLLRPRGVLYVAPPGGEELIDRMRALPSVASLTRLISPAEAAERVPILKPEWTARALLEEGAQDIEVHSLHRGFLRGMKTRGAALFCNSPIQSIQSVGEYWEVIAGGQTFRAARLINAAGAWADEIAQLAGVPTIALEPRRRTAFLIDAPIGARANDWPMVMDAAEEFYFRPDAGRLLLSPADETPSTPCDAQPEDLDVAIAVDRFERATTMIVTQVRHRWAGLRNFVADRSPVCGYDSRVAGFFWLAAQGGYGIQTAPALSRVAAALALSEPVPSDILEFGVRVGDLAAVRSYVSVSPRAT